MSPRKPLLFALLSLAVLAHRAMGDTEVIQFDSPALANNTLGMSSAIRISIYVPPGYSESDESYPTVYYLGGYTGGTYGFPSARQFDDAITAGLIPPVIGIGLPNRTSRHGTMFMNSTAFGMWEDFLIDELMAHVDGNYRTIADPRRRVITGWSAGGYAAVVLPLRHPGLWGGVGTNDAAMQLACGGVFVRQETIEEAADAVDWVGMMSLQIGEAVAPNPDSALGFDSGIDAETFRRIPEAMDLWNSYCFTNPASVERFHDEILAVHRFAITVGGIPANGGMVGLLEGMGANVVGIPITGGHDSFAVERFLEVTADVLDVLESVPLSTGVAPHGKLSVAWGELRTH